MTLSIEELKTIENVIINKILRPYKRRLKYLYTDINLSRNTFIFSNVDEVKFTYCEPLQTTGIVRILNKEHLDLFIKFLDYCKIDLTGLYTCYFTDLLNQWNKVNWDLTKLIFIKNSTITTVTNLDTQEDIIVASSINTYFNLVKIETIASDYINAFINNKFVYLDIPYDDVQKGTISSFVIEGQSLQESSLIPYISKTINLVLINGLDILLTKSLIEKDKKYSSCIRLWNQLSTNSLNYGCYYKDQDIIVCSARDNVCLFPKPLS